MAQPSSRLRLPVVELSRDRARQVRIAPWVHAARIATVALLLVGLHRWANATAAGLVKTTIGQASAAGSAGPASTFTSLSVESGNTRAPSAAAARRTGAWPPEGRSEMTYHPASIGADRGLAMARSLA